MATIPDYRPILGPEQVTELVIRPLIANSIAGQVLSTVNTAAPQYRVPIVAADPSAAWVAEGQEIPASDADIDELIVTPKKLAGLSIISSELAADSSPAAQQVVGDGLVRDLVRKLDKALFTAATTNGPAGLPSLSGVQVITAGAAFTNVDPFSDAQFAAAGANANITSWVTSPATASALAKVKKGTGSAEPILGADVTVPGRRQILGAPLLAAPDAPDGVVWGVDSTYSTLVVREGSTVEVDKSVFFTSDRVAIRCKTRLGFAFSHPASVVKIQVSA